MKGGVIIIGSLLWDNDIRKKWREDRLNCDEAFRVFLPIRYGKRSQSRYNTYTMVFSKECQKNKNMRGTGWIIPLKKEISDFSDLEKEAKTMGEAEIKPKNGDPRCVLFRKWFSVALLVNKNKNKRFQFKKDWTKLISSNRHKITLKKTHLCNETPSIFLNGFLAIKWPEEVNEENKIQELDFLIATVTLPTFINGKYLFELNSDYNKYLTEGDIMDEMLDVFNNNKYSLSNKAIVFKIDKKGKNWAIIDSKNKYFLIDNGTDLKIYYAEYPTSRHISDAMKEQKYYDYFLKNRQYGITTFQDEEILKNMQNEFTKFPDEKKLKELIKDRCFRITMMI